jgi:hypothetical protein
MGEPCFPHVPPSSCARGRAVSLLSPNKLCSATRGRFFWAERWRRTRGARVPRADTRNGDCHRRGCVPASCRCALSASGQLSVRELSGQDLAFPLTVTVTIKGCVPASCRCSWGVAFPLTVTVTVKDVCLHRDAAARRELWATRHTLCTRCLTPARRSTRIATCPDRPSQFERRRRTCGLCVPRAA